MCTFNFNFKKIFFFDKIIIKMSAKNILSSATRYIAGKDNKYFKPNIHISYFFKERIRAPLLRIFFIMINKNFLINIEWGSCEFNHPVSGKWISFSETILKFLGIFSWTLIQNFRNSEQKVFTSFHKFLTKNKL